MSSTGTCCIERLGMRLNDQFWTTIENLPQLMDDTWGQGAILRTLLELRTLHSFCGWEKHHIGFWVLLWTSWQKWCHDVAASLCATGVLIHGEVVSVGSVADPYLYVRLGSAGLFLKRERRLVMHIAFTKNTFKSHKGSWNDNTKNEQARYVI